jgi:hypothetical protein
MLALVAGPGVAQDSYFKSGNTLLDACTSDDIWSNGHCRGFIMGVSDTVFLSYIIEGNESPFVRACVPAGVTDIQLKDVFVKYTQENPETRHVVAGHLVHAALLDAFPCE